MAEGVPTNNQRGQRSGPCRLWGGFDKARHIVPTALLVRVQCFRNGSYKAVEGPSTRPIVLSMITGTYMYCRRRRRLTIFEPDKMKFGVSLTLLKPRSHRQNVTGAFLERWKKNTIHSIVNKYYISKILYIKNIFSDIQIGPAVLRPAESELRSDGWRSPD